MSDRSFAYNILRFGLGLTFVWIGFMIINDPVGWGGFVRPWAQELVPGSVEGFMRGVAIADIVIGGLIALGFWVRFASLLASLHLVAILIASGVDSVTVRDIGLLGTSIALASWSPSRKKKIAKIEKSVQSESKKEAL